MNSPAPAPTDDVPVPILDDEEEARLDAEAERDVAAGRVIPHDIVVAWIDDLIAGRKRPPPEPWR